MIQPALNGPCYIFYRMDERNAYDNYLWIFLTYTPDDAKVRQSHQATPIGYMYMYIYM